MIPWFKPHYWGNEKLYVLDALDSNWISNGEYVRKFESTFGILLHSHTNSSITVSNGTTALYLALITLDIGPGDEVIIPGYTFGAPANMVIAAGAKPVFVDVDPDTWLLDPAFIEEKITNKTKAIIPVHIYGNICDMDAINKIAKNYNLYVIEDVAEAAFSKQNNKYAGTLGDVGCFSFQATKTVTMGEGGAVVFSDNSHENRARLIRNHGMYPEKPYWHLEIGHNFRLTNMQAAFGLAQLEKIQEILFHKSRVYNHYKNRLAPLKGIQMQKITLNTEPTIWAIAITIDPKLIPIPRDIMRLQLADKGIETRGGFFSFEEMPLYSSYSPRDLTVSRSISQNLISFPSFASLQNEQIDYICDAFINIGMGLHV